MLRIAGTKLKQHPLIKKVDIIEKCRFQSTALLPIGDLRVKRAQVSLKEVESLKMHHTVQGTGESTIPENDMLVVEFGYQHRIPNPRR